MNIIEHTVEKIEDTTGILSGERYEFFINVEVDEDDDLYSENGLYIKVIFAVNEGSTRIMHYDIFEKTTDKYIDFALEEEEEKLLQDYCTQHAK
ncbi:pullulanase [Anaerobacillus alkaliphilus]|uniref:Pullulanase n=1 Tax=Anaerobacillus alkaliphilus TaxID=1548597 RepID=A0A4Q0VMC4_9BACI|nr:DUF6509 family protein [Anaerobacillus alkaliphilus]RXI95579.1 pullulanase [Anaerobacillus alkaliphilus]